MFLLKNGEEYLYSLCKNNFPQEFKITWQCKVLIKDKNTFNIRSSNYIIVGTTENIQENEFYDFKKLNNYFVELLKSNLQKCIRRGLSESAVRTAFLLINNDLTSFLRRIINIIAEDSIIHPKLINIIWLYIAHTKGYKITVEQVNELLEIVYQVCECKYHDLIITNPKFAKIQNCENDFIIDTINDFGIKVDKCCFALLLRSIYGGMKNDMIFLRSLSKIWKERIEKNVDDWCFLMNQVWKNEKMPIFDLKFSENDKYLFSVDQHCYGNSFCIKISNKYTLEEIKEAIWYWRSSYTNKTLLSDVDDYISIVFQDDPKRIAGMIKTELIWNDIKNIVEKNSAYYWNKNF